MDTQMKLKCMKTRRKVIIMFLITVFFAITISLTGCWGDSQKSHFNRAKEIIYNQTSIEIPSEAKTIYSAYDEAPLVPGRRAHLVVFEFENEPSEWLKKNKFLFSEDDKESAAEDKYYFERDFHFMNFDEEQIPKEHIPNFDISYFWKYKHAVHFYYYPSNLKLIVYITGT